MLLCFNFKIVISFISKANSLHCFGAIRVFDDIYFLMYGYAIGIDQK